MQAKLCLYTHWIALCVVQLSGHLLHSMLKLRRAAAKAQQAELDDAGSGRARGRARGGRGRGRGRGKILAMH